MSPEYSRRIHEPYVLAALLFALTTGFGLGAILVASLAFRLLGSWWISSVQAHGHAQLLGWAGLFVLGVGLYFFPRLRGTRLVQPRLGLFALACLSIGIALRSVAQPLLGLLADERLASSAIAGLLRIGLVVSALSEIVGAVLVVAVLVSSYWHAGPLSSGAPILPVRGYLALAFISLVAALVLNLILSIQTAFRGGYAYPSNWDDALTHLLLMGFVLPVSIAMSVRSLPLFMRLAAPPRRELGPLLVVLLIGLISRLLGLALQVFIGGVDLDHPLSGAGAVLEGSVLAAFIWIIDIPLRRKPPWTTSRLPIPPEVAAKRKPTRKNYPDYGEYGRFELLIISAYVWLAFSSVVAIINGAGTFISGSPVVNPDLERHAFTLGYITLLIFGMGVRMLPGFSGKNGIASPRLVLATFWLGNLATILRVFPLLAPDWHVANFLLGISGVIGWLAVGFFGLNLWRTWKPQPSPVKTYEQN